ncbi:hypothetical protein EAF04_003052 [Stromatinia cepivora]|nr:hypothetical protein EAF04_003052 [Stromatinia cepivora]
MASPTKLQEYALSRPELLADEKKYRGDHEFFESLSPTAQAASTIVSRIQQLNRRVLFDPRGQTRYLHPESCFSHLKQPIERTALFEIIKKMPKGAILRAHHAACVSLDFIIDKMIETPGMYISATRPLDTYWAKREKKIKIKFVYNNSQVRERYTSPVVFHTQFFLRAECLVKNCTFIQLGVLENQAARFEIYSIYVHYAFNFSLPLVSCWLLLRLRSTTTDSLIRMQPRMTRSAIKRFGTLTTNPSHSFQFLLLHRLTELTLSMTPPYIRNEYPQAKTAFVAWLKNRVMDQRTPHSDVGISHAWRKFQTGIRLINTMIHNEPVFRPFLRKFFEGLYEDNVKWIEIRMIFKLEGTDTVSGELEMARVIFEEREKFANIMKKKGEDWWGLRVIWTGLRQWEDEVTKDDMENCMRVKKRYPDLISGYDPVGQEGLGRTLEDLTPVVLWFKEQCEQRNLNIPFFLHAGGCLGTGNVIDHKLYDAILLGARRIGHGYSLLKHPLLEELCKEHQIMVESCPISNESLRLAHSTSAHTLPILLAKGVGASLNCDNPYLLGQDITGVSMEFFTCIWPGIIWVSGVWGI